MIRRFSPARQQLFEFAPELADATALSIEHMLQGLATLGFPFVIFSEAPGGKRKEGDATKMSKWKTRMISPGNFR